MKILLAVDQYNILRFLTIQTAAAWGSTVSGFQAPSFFERREVIELRAQWGILVFLADQVALRKTTKMCVKIEYPEVDVLPVVSCFITIFPMISWP